MRIFDYICLFVIITSVGTIYKKYLDKIDKDEEFIEYDAIKKYLLNDSSITKNNKPIIWVHIPYEYNSRLWESFYSRNSNDLNLQYLNLTIKSIIEHNTNFNICLIDDNSFMNLIPGWTVDITTKGDPIKSKLRNLCLYKLLYTYGGIIVPSSFLCLQSLEQTHNNCIQNGKPYVFENINKSFSNSINITYGPDISFIGSNKNNSIIKDLCDFTEKVISDDFTSDSNFSGIFNKWCLQSINNKKMTILDGNTIGIKDVKNKPIYAEELLANNTINFIDEQSLLGIYIPMKDILSKNSLSWFNNLTFDKLLKSKMNISKYFVLSLSNNSN